ncbi:MAG: response regulator [Pyrinomonadaceae bacterium]
MHSLMVVEDDPTLRELLFELFSDKYYCATAKSAEEALARLGTEAIDLVLTDISMSGMSGLELLGHIKQSWPQIQVIIISGIRDKDYAEGLIKMGAFEYLVKPFELLDVYMSVERAMELYGDVAEGQPDAAHLPEQPGKAEEPAEEPAEVFSSIQLNKVFTLADLLEMVQRSRMNGYICLNWDSATVEAARGTGRFTDADGQFDEAINHRAATIYLRDGLMIDATVADSESDPNWRDAEESLVTLVRLSTWASVGLRAWGFSTSDMRRPPRLSVNDNSGKLFGIITADEGSWDESGEEPPAPAGDEVGQPPVWAPL